ncbi:sulfatase-like hydrolase/transferase [Rubritalea profundi]|uniref:Sulfatase N-terminal domain-containing protein n=1 Tax=Rubritalea profundi TaxID=1658618 RepID=A0A2S7U0N1_9BACT|nr:sulfatase-like hydrolase/transferase [Rubritalea profundi]PQJ28556.1 hypothetical protein BSZ32_08565 [Rubritalea profundi]
MSHNPDKQGFEEPIITFNPKPKLKQPWQTQENDGHNVALITKKSLNFIDRNKDEPFFLMVSHNSVHDPMMKKAALISKYRAKSGVDIPEIPPWLRRGLKP